MPPHVDCDCDLHRAPPCYYPFQDGNGRLSRVLTTLLLLKAGYLYVPYASLERIVEDNKDTYYLALRRADTTLYTDNSRMNEWIVFFLVL